MLMRTKLALNKTKIDLLANWFFFAANPKKKTFFYCFLLRSSFQFAYTIFSSLFPPSSFGWLWSFGVQPIRFLREEVCLLRCLSSHNHTSTHEFFGVKFCSPFSVHLVVNAIVFSFPVIWLFGHYLLPTIRISPSSLLLLEMLNTIFPSKCLASIVFRLTIWYRTNRMASSAFISTHKQYDREAREIVNFLRYDASFSHKHFLFYYAVYIVNGHWTHTPI